MTFNNFVLEQDHLLYFLQLLKKDVNHYSNFKSIFTFIFWTKEQRQKSMLWKKRMVFLIENKMDILVELLSREDYHSNEARAEAIIKIHEWLQKIKHQNHEVNIKDWIEDIKKDFEKSVSIQTKSLQKLKALPIPKPKPPYFYQIFKGENDDEKKKKFDNLVSILLAEGWITEDTKRQKYIWKEEAHGGRLNLAGFFFILNKYHLAFTPNPKEVTVLINQWLIHDFTFDSLTKALQKSKQELFLDRNNKQYIEDFEVILSKL